MDRKRQRIEWPDDPYKGLAYYEARDRHLFAGRDEEIATCARLLAKAQTRLLILHGQTGCGKSSFLRAGLIPALEENGIGYLFLRSETAPGVWEPAFIRCGADPVAAIAKEVFRFAGQPQLFPTARGPESIDVSAARLGARSCQEFLDLCSDPEQLCLALQELAAAVSHTLVLILDQAEELITMNTAHDNQRRFSRFVRDMVASGIDMRFLIAIRKDHSGPFIGSLQADNDLSLAFRTFFLNDLNRKGIRAAIERPTLDSLPDLPDEEGPYAHYRFKYAPDVIDQIAKDLDESLPSGATLPVMQIVCRDLYDQVRRTPHAWEVKMDSYKEGRIRGRIKQHVVGSLRSLLAAQTSTGNSSSELELKWLRVLERMVQTEGDGRVYTNAANKGALRNWARDEKIEAAIDPVLDGLADPKVFILRRFGVSAPGASAEQELLCLGHDMVGIAILAALEDASTKRQVSGAVRKNTAHLVAAGALVAAILAGIGLLRAHVDVTRRVNDLLALSLVSRNTDIVRALMAARDAWQQQEGSPFSDPGPGPDPKQTMAALLTGFPDIVESSGVASLKPGANLTPVHILGKGNGFARLRQDRVVDVVTVDAAGAADVWSTPPLALPVPDVHALGAFGIVDLSRDRLLALYATTGGTPVKGVIGVDRNGTQKHFGEAELVDALGDRGKASGTTLLGLSANAAVLYRWDPTFNQGYPGVVAITPQFTLSPDVGIDNRPALAGTEISGNYLVSSLTERSGTPDDHRAIPESSVLRVMARSIQPAGPVRSWDVRDFAALHECRRTSKKAGSCQVSRLPDLSQPGLVVLGLWIQKDSRLARWRWTVSHLLVADAATGGQTEVDLLRVSGARQKCAVSGLKPDASASFRRQQPLNDDDVPVFLVKGRDGLLFGFATTTSAQLINVSDPAMPCKEIYFPESQVNGWRMSDDGTRLLGSTRYGGYIWNLRDAVPAEQEAIQDRLARICKGGWTAGERRDAGAAAGSTGKPASLWELCQGPGKVRAPAPRALQSTASGLAPAGTPRQPNEPAA